MSQERLALLREVGSHRPRCPKCSSARFSVRRRPGSTYFSARCPDCRGEWDSNSLFQQQPRKKGAKRTPGEIMRREERRRRAADLGEHRQRGPRMDGLTEAEREFAERAGRRGWKVYRDGWPDLLCVDPETDARFLVEVKSPTDRIGENQEILFAALELSGMQVRIYTPGTEKLTHWRTYAYGSRDGGFERSRALLERKLACVALIHAEAGAGSPDALPTVALGRDGGEDPKGEKRTG